jgi:hypothetical protein
MPPEKFRFRKHSSVGAASAEDDSQFLSTCFVDTGDLTTLLDSSDPRRLVLGRTGSGKSALLLQIQNRSNAATINPQTLAFNHVTNSTVLQFFLAAGVKLDLFFRLLWRHVFAVELLKEKYHVRTEAESRSLLERLFALVSRDKNASSAEFVGRFWLWESSQVVI